MGDEQHESIIAGRLRLAREWAGLSQGQVARMLGYHRPTVTEMEAGRRKVTAEEVRRLAGIYGVDAGWLLGMEATEPDAERDRLELAARELARMAPEDLTRLMDLLAALRRPTGGEQ